MDDLEEEFVDTSSSGDSEREDNFIVVVPRFSDIQFKRQFRMEPNQYEVLCENLAPYKINTSTCQIDYQKEVLIALWNFGKHAVRYKLNAVKLITFHIIIFLFQWGWGPVRCSEEHCIPFYTELV